MEKRIFLTLFLAISLASCTKVKDNEAQNNKLALSKERQVTEPAIVTDEKQTLNVLSLSGLNLRSSPNEKSSVIITVPYGSEVTILGKEQSHGEVKECDNYTFKGNWVYAQFKDKKGYLFRTYLSQWPAPKSGNEEYITQYLEGCLKKIKESSLKPKGMENVFDYLFTEYSEGVSYEQVSAEGGANHKVWFPKQKITIEEAFLLGTAFEAQGAKKNPCSFVSSENRLVRNTENSEISASEENNQIILQIGIAD